MIGNCKLLNPGLDKIHFFAYSEDVSPLIDSCGEKWWWEERTELGMINFLVCGMHLETDQDLAGMNKHTPKRIFLGIFFAWVCCFLPASMA